MSASKDLRGPLGYAFALAAVLAAFVIRSLAHVWFQTNYPYLTYFVAVLLTAYLAGFWPAALGAVISASIAHATFAPSHFLVAAPASPLLGGLVFGLTALLSAGVVEALRRSNGHLARERERYAALAEARDLLYRELQHRVSNNIQLIAALLQLQGQTANQPTAQRALGEAALRIGLIAKIQRELYGPAGDPAPFHRFASELLTDALSAAGAERVTVSITGGEAPLHPSQATSVSLVLLECVNNALEHAFADGRGGALQVSLRPEGEDWTLTITDDGAGLPPGTRPDAGKSLGLKIVQSMAGQLGGAFSIGPAPGRGVLCRLTFPILG